jgi:hypothetical protein
MSHFDYECSKQIIYSDPPFYALIMAAMRRADTANSALLQLVFPGVWDELQQRYHAPGGLLPAERSLSRVIRVHMAAGHPE